jgi:hypothetical protein
MLAPEAEEIIEGSLIYILKDGLTREIDESSTKRIVPSAITVAVKPTPLFTEVC